MEREMQMWTMLLAAAMAGGNKVDKAAKEADAALALVNERYPRDKQNRDED